MDSGLNPDEIYLLLLSSGACSPKLLRSLQQLYRLTKKKLNVCIRFLAERRETFLSVDVGLFGWHCQMSKRCSAALVFVFQMVLTGLLFNSGVWDLVCCYGNEILQLQKSNAWDNCWCQVLTCLLFLSVFLNKHFI